MFGGMSPAEPHNSALPQPATVVSRVIRYFQLEAPGTTPRREILGGVTTFLAMSYIIFVQPGVLSQAGMNFQAVMAATCLSAALATLLFLASRR